MLYTSCACDRGMILANLVPSRYAMTQNLLIARGYSILDEFLFGGGKILDTEI